MNTLQFSGKAQTLHKLQGKLRFARLLPQLHFCLKDWLDAGSQWRELGLQAPWLSETLIVRSSAKTEDQQLHSNAGEFLSVAGVQGSAQIQEAIERVIKSFLDNDVGHQILIQPMVKNIWVSGVAFSYEPGQPSPYYVVNYDSESQTSHLVTQGLGDQLGSLYVAKSANPELQGWKKQLLELLKELEGLFGNDAIDVEFVVTSDNELILLQVRPLALPAEKLITIGTQEGVLAGLKSKYKLTCLEHEKLMGGSNLLGVMPDWNPAEIIGLRPKSLARSLYQRLVTDSVWAEQRFEYGYRDVRGVPLMLDLGGIPYVDVRASFNSFVAKQLPDKLASQLVDFYLGRLKSHPQWHDKVEFEVVFASDHFSLKEDLKVLLNHGFSAKNCDFIRTTLKELTHSIIDKNTGFWIEDFKKIKQLNSLSRRVMDSALDDKAKLERLLNVSCEFGSKPFAGLARTAFVATMFLKSMVKVGVLSKADHECFMRSIATLSGGILAAGNATDRNQFLQEYGHMRPGMYNLLASRYDEMPQENFSWSAKAQIEAPSSFVLNLKQQKQLDDLLIEQGYGYTAAGFIKFVRGAIERREKAKYIYGRTLSEVLTLCQKLGNHYQLGDEQLEYLEVEQILQLSTTENALKLVKKAKNQFKITRSLILPPLIASENDIDCFELQVQQPNYITLKRVTAPVINLTSACATPAESLRGSIVLLTNADPGFDWLFAHHIAGLITLYGGCNSHMAIRAAELGLPAVIGAGEVLFGQCEAAKLLCLDCEQHSVFRLQ